VQWTNDPAVLFARARTADAYFTLNAQYHRAVTYLSVNLSDAKHGISRRRLGTNGRSRIRTTSRVRRKMIRWTRRFLYIWVHASSVTRIRVNWKRVDLFGSFWNRFSRMINVSAIRKSKLTCRKTQRVSRKTHFYRQRSPTISKYSCRTTAIKSINWSVSRT